MPNWIKYKPLKPEGPGRYLVARKGYSYLAAFAEPCYDVQIAIYDSQSDHWFEDPDIVMNWYENGPIEVEAWMELPKFGGFE